MSCANRFIPKLGFPRREIITLALCVVTHLYTLVSLFPYVGIMAKDMLALDSINEAGDGPSRISVISRKHWHVLFDLLNTFAYGFFVPLKCT